MSRTTAGHTLAIGALALLATAALSSGQRSEIARIIPLTPAGAGGGYFGFRMVAEADRLVIGNQLRSPTQALDRAVEVFERVAGGWVRTPPPPMPPGETILDGVATSLAVSGDIIVAGTLAGNFAWIMESLGGGQWAPGIRIPNPTSHRSLFGRTVALGPGVLAVGAPSFDGTTWDREGRVYLYERSTPGPGWALVQTIEPPTAFVQEPGFGYGNKLVMAGGRLAVVGGIADRDLVAVMVYEPGVNGWDLVQTIRDPDPAVAMVNLNPFAWSIALSSDVLVIGRKGDSSVSSEFGEALVYEQDAAGVWRLSAILQPSNQTANDRFGQSVAVHGDVIVVGAPKAPGGPSGRGGQAFVFRRRPDGTWPTSESERLVAADGLSEGFGYTVVAGPGFAVVHDWHRSDQGAFVYGVGQEEDVCNPAAGSGAVTCHLDTFGSSIAGTSQQGVTLSDCVPSTRYLIVGSLTPSLGGGGPVIGGMPLCLTGSLLRLASGQVGAQSTLEFVEPGAWSAPGIALFSVAQTIYLQGFAAEPGGPIGFTNAIRWDLQ